MSVIATGDTTHAPFDGCIKVTVFFKTKPDAEIDYVIGAK
jgi:hypothetical protein